ncbi:MAG: glycosyltransferase, partial [Candidatus Omnitrophica bacterium]|nr:glycosyltransferase [Candidatus Omnitrophota bacterium]
MRKITIVVCTFNRADQLGETLERFSTQELPSDCEVELLVVDNNSNDNTRDVISKWAEKMPFPLRYYFEGRQGKSFAMNCGIANASGDLLAFT